MNRNRPANIGIQCGLIALLTLSSLAPLAQNLLAQDKDWRSAIQDALESQYSLTKASADKSTIVTAGAILVLKKDDLVMFTTSSLNPPANTYKDGRITQGLFGKLGKAANDGTTRTFVRGEKFWVTKIEIKDDGVVFQFLSDPFNDVRYVAALRFPFAKGSPPSPDQIAKTVAQVLAVDDSASAAPPADSQPLPAPGTPVSRSRSPFVPPAYPQTSSPVVQAQMQLVIAQLEASLQTAPTPEAQARIRAMIERMKAAQGLAAAQATAPAVEAPLPAIPPPPPPPPDPVVETKSIEAGQTKDQVMAILGKPEKTFKIGTKEIYQYKDVKVTFVNGKMTDAQ